MVKIRPLVWTKRFRYHLEEAWLLPMVFDRLVVLLKGDQRWLVRKHFGQLLELRDPASLMEHRHFLW